MNFRGLIDSGKQDYCDVDTMSDTNCLSSISAARWILPEVVDRASQTLDICVLRSEYLAKAWSLLSPVPLSRYSLKCSSRERR